MREIFRSKDFTALLLKKQFLAENDIPGRILLDGMDITDLPFSPRYGTSYHLNHEAILVVDDEDEQAAYDFLDNIEVPIGEAQPIRNRFGQTGEDVQRAWNVFLRFLGWLSIFLLLAAIGYGIWLSIS